MRLNHVLTDKGSFIRGNAPTSDSKNIYLTSRYNITQNQNLELRYSLANGGGTAPDTADSQNQSVYFSYLPIDLAHPT